MAQVTSRYRYPDPAERKLIEQEFHNMEARKQLEKKLGHLDNKVKDTVIQLESSRQEIFKIRSQNKSIQKKIEEGESEVKNLHTKLGSLKVKLGMANATLNTSNDEKEKLRTSLNEVQIDVARLEERLTAANADLDRLRDPANPESNMSIKKHVVNDKREIKRLKNEIDNETSMLDIDKETTGTKDMKIKVLEKELGKMKGLLKECEKERTEAQDEEEFERKRKEDLMNEFQTLKIDRRSYDQRIKELKVKLGISVANQNVSAKLENQLKRDEKSLSRQMKDFEKKLKESTGQLNVFKNQHKMSKTAQSINEYTRRNQQRRGSDGAISLAQSGPGPIQFGSAATKDQSKTGSLKGSMPSIPERLRASDGAKGKQEVNKNGGKQKQTATGAQQQGQKLTARSVGGTSRSKFGSPRVSSPTRSRASTEKHSSNQLIPPPKPKLQRKTPR